MTADLMDVLNELAGRERGRRRVETVRGTFEVSYSVDRIPENRTYTVYISQVADEEDRR